MAACRVDDCANLAGGIIIQRGGLAVESDWLLALSGADIIIATAVLDLTAVAEYTVTLPNFCRFWIDELGLLITGLDTLTVQPTVRFGISGSPAKHRVAALTTLLTAVAKRERWTPLAPEDGETSMTFGVTVGATATALEGRAYWRGMLVESEA
jgi:hypothetical protein